MAALDFPISPSVGQTYTSGGIVWSFDGAKWVNGTGVTGVTSWNTRTGAVAMNSGDVTTALTFTPYNTTNPSGYQTAANVTAALVATQPGAFSTLSSSGAYTPAQVAGIVGTTTNNNAAAGAVGEYLRADLAQGSAVAIGTGTLSAVLGLNLPAGDWDVNGTLVFTASASASTVVAGLSTSSTAFSADALARTEIAVAGLLSFTQVPVGPARLSLATTTPVDLLAYLVLASGTATAWGSIGARRVR